MAASPKWLGVLLVSFIASAPAWAGGGDHSFLMKYAGGELKCRKKPNSPVLAIPAAKACGRESGQAKTLCTMQVLCTHKTYRTDLKTREIPTEVSITEGTATCMGGTAYNPAAGKAVEGCPEVAECINDTRIESKVVMTNDELGSTGTSSERGTKSRGAVEAR